jgi:hypothetical protein
MLLPLIVQYGIPVAYQIWQTISKHPAPTQEAWDDLLVLNAKPLSQYVIDAGGTPPPDAPAAGSTQIVINPPGTVTKAP